MTKKTNIGQQKNLTIFANTFVTTRALGGGDRFLISCLPALADRARITVVTTRIGHHHLRKTASKKVHFTVLPSTLFDGRDNKILVMCAYAIRTVQSLVSGRKTKTTHILSASPFFPDVIPAFVAKRRDPGIRWVARLYHLVDPPTRRHGNILVNIVASLLQELMLKLLKSADLIVADNPDTLRTLQLQGFANATLAMLVSGVDFRLISTHRPQQRFPFDAAYVGRIDPHKGVFDLPEIWNRVIKTLPKARLAIVGYGPPHTVSSLKRKIALAGLGPKNLMFLGFLPHRKGKRYPLFDLLKSIKILLIPNHEGGWPLVVAESMAAGTPVVGYRLPVFGGVFTGGFLASRPRDTQSLAKNVINLLTDEEKRLLLVRAARREAKRFDIALIAQNFSGLVLEDKRLKNRMV